VVDAERVVFWIDFCVVYNNARSFLIGSVPTRPCSNRPVTSNARDVCDFAGVGFVLVVDNRVNLLLEWVETICPSDVDENIELIFVEIGGNRPTYERQLVGCKVLQGVWLCIC